jgi:YegS/Rv2252/BmrU family lipid kinase
MEYHVIYNPAAGRGYGQRIEKKVLDLLNSQLVNYNYHLTNAPGHAQEIASNLKDTGTMVIVAGGDGTIHEVVNGIIGGKCILGILPIGSGNDFVKSLNINKNLLLSLKGIKEGNYMTIDVGKINDIYFPNGLGIGFDAVVVMETNKIKRLRGALIYLYAVFKALNYYKNQRVRITINGSTEEKDIFMISVGNGTSMGGGFKLTPLAKLDDGLLDVCVFNRLTKMEIYKNLPKAINGKHLRLSQVDMQRTTKLIVESESGIPLHTDGELISSNLKRIEIEIVPNALKIIHNLERPSKSPKENS